MAFIVVNSVRASHEDLPAIVLKVQRLELEAIGDQPGFKSARLMVAEDGTEAVLTIEWASREHFVAYRQTEIGRRMVEEAIPLHPHIAFYDVINVLDSPGEQGGAR